MDIYFTIFELIDMRSFTSMWFWIMLAVFWSMMSHYVLGVPYDLVQRASRKATPEKLADIEVLVRINSDRLLFIGGTAGLIVTALATFILTTLALLGFLYGIEFSQALFLIAFPFSIIGLLSQQAARRIRIKNPRGEDLIQSLRRHRLATQIVGVISIFVTAFWGIFQAMSANVLGG